MLAVSSSGTIVMSKWAASPQEHGILYSRDVKEHQVHTVEQMEVFQQLQSIKLLSLLRNLTSLSMTMTNTTSRDPSIQLILKDLIGIMLILLASKMFTLQVKVIVRI
jgi:hypothetical protein